ncbi:protein of unknown function [Pseudomonas sp. JV241A]|nr:protein of unknown function [Pseudomonas sp. JV241A]
MRSTLNPASGLWEPDLPAIERAAVAIQATLDVLAAPASSLASQLPQVRCTQIHCGSGGATPRLAPRFY